MIGWGEQMVIRRHTLLAIRWLLASAIGAILGAVILAIPGIPSIYIRMQGTANIDPIYLLLWVPGFILLVGLIMGLLQWLAIRKTVSRAGTWIWKRVLSSFSFLLLSCPASLLAIILAGMNYGLFMVGQITPSPMDEQVMDNFVYIYFLIVLTIPAALSALISGLFMRNLLESSAQKIDFEPGYGRSAP